MKKILSTAWIILILALAGCSPQPNSQDRKRHVVYQTGWFPYPPERCPKHIYFDTPDEVFVVVKSDAKFNVTKNGDAYGFEANVLIQKHCSGKTDGAAGGDNVSQC